MQVIDDNLVLFFFFLVSFLSPKCVSVFSENSS